VVLGSEKLKTYLINFARSIMYTTALPPHSLLAIQESYHLFPTMMQKRMHLQQLIQQFQKVNLVYEKLISLTPIQAVIIPGNEKVKKVSKRLFDKGFDVRPILYPTVPEGKERLRIVLHAFNTDEELSGLIECLQIED
jgi:8-amino-7-oxononanoate synthase